MNGQQVGALNVPAIRKSEDIEDIRRLLAQQEEGNSRDREYLKTQIGERTADVLRQAERRLDEEVFTLVLERGVRFAQAVLGRLTVENSTLESVPDTTCSLYGLKARLSQRGISEFQLTQAEQEYTRARESLRSMAGDVLRSAQKALFRKAWQEGLNHVRTDCLAWMGETNQRTLQLHAQRQAANLYEQLGDHARKLKASLASVQQTLERVHEKLEEAAQNHLNYSSTDRGIYELTIEAVGPDYIQSYYQSSATTLDPVAVYRSLGQSLSVRDLQQLANWSEADWVDALKTHARKYFAGDVENTSLLQAMTQYYGRQAQQKIEAQFDRLVRYCHPFWQYDANSGIQGQEGKSIIGVEDEHSDLIPPKYREDPQYEIKSTGFRHRIDFARVQHGLPSFLLRDMQDYKAYYDARRKGLDPLHVFPEAFLADEVIPEEKIEARHIFGCAAAFGYVIQVGSYYYFDPQKEYASRGIRPQRENRLEQGREKAEDAFVQRDDLLRQAEQLIERDIVNMGNQAAIRLLEERVLEYKQALARMAPDGDLRRQMEDEICALTAKQQQLGKMWA